MHLRLYLLSKYGVASHCVLHLHLRIYLLNKYGVASLILGHMITFTNILIEFIWSFLPLCFIAFVSILIKYAVVSLNIYEVASLILCSIIAFANILIG